MRDLSVSGEGLVSEDLPGAKAAPAGRRHLLAQTAQGGLRRVEARFLAGHVRRVDAEAVTLGFQSPGF